MKLTFDKEDPSRIWLNMQTKDAKKGRIESRGQVKVQIDVLPADQADKNPVGKARKEPNHSPLLSPPEGRVTLSVNPLKMYE